MSKVCTKIQNWLLLHPGEMPAFVEKHKINCPDCAAFAKEEMWIHDQLKAVQTATPKISLDHSLRVKQAIWETSKVLSMNKKQSFLFPKVAAMITTFSLLLLFLLAPFHQGETYFGYLINQKLSAYLNNNETLTLASLENDATTSSLKFVSQYVNTSEEKSFYYSTDSLSKEKYLLISFLSKKTKVSVEQIYDWYKKGGYAFLLRKLNLPFQKTVAEIQKYINQFRTTPLTPTFSLDGYITWVDYNQGSLWIDSYNREIILDSLLLHSVYIGLYENFTLKEEDGRTICIKKEKALFPNVMVSGKVAFQNDQEIRLEGNPTQIRCTTKTIFNNGQSFLPNTSYKDILVRVRAVLVNDQMNAITISPLVVGLDRTMSGSLDQVYQYGFTMQNLKISFCYESLPKLTLTNLPAQTFVTVTGKDFGKYFIVSSMTVIANPNPVTPEPNYYLAKADTPSRMARQISSDTTYDFVVAGDEKDLYLASGKTLSTQSGKFPIGSKIKMTTNQKSDLPTISLVEIGSSSIYRGNVVFQEKLGNGCYVYTSEQKDRQFILFPKKGTNIPQTGTLQGVMIQYDHFAIMIDYRLFQIKLLQTTKGLVTKIMQETRMVVLDNGVMVKMDDWTQMNDGNLGVGKTLQLLGVFEQGIFNAYVLTIEKEMVMFKGVIVELNPINQTIKLDSGQILTYNSQTNLQLQKKQLQIGDLIYVKAYLNDMVWMASEIWTPREGLEDLGETL